MTLARAAQNDERLGASPGRVVAIAVFDGVEMLDVAGPAQVFSTAERVSGGQAAYRPMLVGARRGPVRTAAGMRVVAERSWHELETEADTFLVPGGMRMRSGEPLPLVDPGLVTWLGSNGSRAAARLVSVCSGAHVLAAAGLLRGRRATTHWATAARLAAEHPHVTVEADSIFVRDGTVWTCAGGAAAIDLALAMVAQDYGHELARRVGQGLVVHLRREGGQTQFSGYLGPRGRSTSERLEELLAWIPSNLREELSVEALARRVNVSRRHFARLFRDEVGSTPASYVERVRVQAAIDQLVHTDSPLSTVAAMTGFGSPAALHRVFVRRHGLSPGEYRRRFAVSLHGPAAGRFDTDDDPRPALAAT
ncbi:GlxA family transcriptional regulator [Prauserella flavalba]|uniref:HTH araC/xylS-type domain-containing protein n=1 Tax=Prauserella flavalba TaxID=1477506 RepID=A0A318MGF9_9PSEU|nr:GlxA family transcriptional regulator [Prauserella flavalba]PXY38230.1 hypothetical protein BA062_00230 [Prauserella flavalba]